MPPRLQDDEAHTHDWPADAENSSPPAALLSAHGDTGRQAAAERERENVLTLVARLYYIDGLDQSAIAGIVGLSRSQISRMLAHAREMGIVRISVDPYEVRVPGLEAALVSRYHVHRAVVIRALPGAGDVQVRRTLGFFAGPVVSEWIRPGSVVGLAGGRTVAEVVANMKPPARSAGGIRAVQLMGNIGPSVTNIDAAELSRTLARAFGGVYCALSAPAFAPDSVTRDAFMAHAHMRSIWQLFATMDQAMVGIGSLEESAFIERGILAEADLRQFRAAGAVGEICGRFYDRDGLECAVDHSRRVISITLDELRQAADVVGVTAGGRRVEAVQAALNSRLVKSLVTDRDGAAALLAAE